MENVVEKLCKNIKSSIPSKTSREVISLIESYDKSNFETYITDTFMEVVNDSGQVVFKLELDDNKIIYFKNNSEYKIEKGLGTVTKTFRVKQFNHEEYFEDTYVENNGILVPVCNKFIKSSAVGSCFGELENTKTLLKDNNVLYKKQSNFGGKLYNAYYLNEVESKLFISKSEYEKKMQNKVVGDVSFSNLLIYLDKMFSIDKDTKNKFIQILNNISSVSLPVDIKQKIINTIYQALRGNQKKINITNRSGKLMEEKNAVIDFFDDNQKKRCYIRVESEKDNINIFINEDCLPLYENVWNVSICFDQMLNELIIFESDEQKKVLNRFDYQNGRLKGMVTKKRDDSIALETNSIIFNRSSDALISHEVLKDEGYIQKYFYAPKFRIKGDRLNSTYDYQEHYMMDEISEEQYLDYLNKTNDKKRKLFKY